MYIWHYSSWHWAWSVNLTSIQTSKVQLSVKLRSTWRGTFAVLVFTKYVPFFDCLVTIYSLNIDNFPSIFHAHVHLQKPLQKGGTLMMTGVFLLKTGFFNVFFWILKSLTWFLPSWKPPRSHTRCTHLRPCAPIELPSNCQDISVHRFHWNHILPMLKIFLRNICFMFRSFFVVEGRKTFQELVWVASELHGIKRKSFCFTAASSLPPPAGSWEAFGDESQRMINMIELVQCSEPQLKTPTCWSNFWGSHIYSLRPCKSVIYIYIWFA